MTAPGHGAATLRLALPPDALRARPSAHNLPAAPVPEGLPKFTTVPGERGRLQAALQVHGTTTLLELRDISWFGFEGA